MSKKNVFRNIVEVARFNYLLYRVQTPLHKAVKESRRRQKDTALRQAVSDFLNEDIPVHFNGTQPVFYLSRYIATPDYETLSYYEQVSRYNLPIVIGEDTTDIFTAQSSLKRNLLKLPIVSGISKDGSGILEYNTIGDFNSQQGIALDDLKIHNNMNLVAFHKKLCGRFLPSEIFVVDESEWVSRNSRGDLIRLYERMLALFLVHGIMLEQYELDEIDFLESVVWPAMQLTKKRFGHTPLIASLQLKYSKKITDLNSYPAKVGEYAKCIMET